MTPSPNVAPHPAAADFPQADYDELQGHLSLAEKALDRIRNEWPHDEQRLTMLLKARVDIAAAQFFVTAMAGKWLKELGRAAPKEVA